MGKRITWTAEADALILTMRAKRATWDEISAAIGVSRNAAIERGKRLLLEQGLDAAMTLPACDSWPPARVDELRSLAERGFSDTHIGQIMGETRKVITDAREARGIPTNDRPPLPPYHPEAWAIICAGIPSLAGSRPPLGEWGRLT